MKNKDRKLFLQVEYTHLENSEFEETMSEYKHEYMEDFSEEINFLMSTAPAKDETTVKEPEAKMSDQHPYFQSLYRSIAKITHPDKNNGDDEYFKKANTAYSTGDWVELITLCNELRIALPPIPDDVYKEIINCLKSIQESINSNKQSVAWVWGASDKSEQVRDLIRKALGIDPELFEEWKRSKN